MNSIERSRIFVLILTAILLAGVIFPIQTDAFILGTWHVSLDPQQHEFYEYSLAQDDGLIAWVSLESGADTVFFFTNSTGHEALQEGRNATVFHLLNIPEDPQAFYELPFRAPYDDQWYVYLYNQNHVRGAEINILIVHDTEAPEIDALQADKLSPFFGLVTYELTFIDDSNRFRRIEIYLDNELVYSEYNWTWFPRVKMSVTFTIPTYHFSNGNHTLRIEIEDYYGHVTILTQSVEISNSFFDRPENSQLALVFYGIFAFLVLIKLTTGHRIPILPYRTGPAVVLLSASMLCFGLGIWFNEPIEFSASLFSGGFISLSLAGSQGTAYLKSRIDSLTLTRVDIRVIKKEQEASSDSLKIEHLLGRCDILDKVRSNLRNGMSIILGLGTAIVVWLANYGTECILDTVQIGLLVAGLILTVIIAAGIVVSFFPITIEAGNHRVDEGLLAEIEEESYKTVLKSFVIMKLTIIQNMRKSVGLGLVSFVVVVVSAFAFDAIYVLNHASYGIHLVILTGVTLTFILYTLVTLTTTLLMPVLKKNMKIRS